MNGIYFISFQILHLRKSGSVLSVMSYNVRLFNKYRWIDKPNISEEIEKLIIQEDPDIVCIQEYSSEMAPELKNINLVISIQIYKSRKINRCNFLKI